MKDKKYSNFKLVLRLIDFTKKLLPYALLSAFFAVGGFLITVAIPGIIVSIGLDGIMDKNIPIIYLILLIGLAIARGLFRYGEHYFGHYLAFKILADFRNAIFAKLRRLAPSKLDSQDSGQLLKIIGEDIEALEVFFAHTIVPITTGIITALILIIYYAKDSLVSALIGLVVYASLAIIIPNIFTNNLKDLLYDQNEMRKSYISYFLESVKGMKDLRQLDKAEERSKDLSDKSQAVNKKEREIARLSYLQFTSSFLIIGFGVLLFAINNLYLIKKGLLDFKPALISIVVFSYSFAPFLELSRLPLGLGRALGAARQTFKLLDEEEIGASYGKAELEESINDIQVDRIKFSYPNSSQIIFDDLSLNFKDNKIIGLVGDSGSGKSSLMKLVMNWYRLDGGKIYLNGVDSSSLDARKLQKRIAYIPQKPQIFSQTIRENLILGKRDIKDEEILEMAERCRMKEKILSTSQGLDTVLDWEKPIFSSGEMQRLELIRAFLKDADLYIFDEPTSNLDSLNEAIIIKLIKDNCKGMVFLISHKMSTVSCGDEIYMLEESRVKDFNRGGIR